MWHMLISLLMSSVNLSLTEYSIKSQSVLLQKCNLPVVIFYLTLSMQPINNDDHYAERVYTAPHLRYSCSKPVASKSVVGCIR